jgi:hypothetical protein
MAETADNQMRITFFNFVMVKAHHNKSLAWGHSRIRYLEKLVKELELKIKDLEITRKQGG